MKREYPTRWQKQLFAFAIIITFMAIGVYILNRLPPLPDNPPSEQTTNRILPPLFQSCPHGDCKG